MSAFPFVFAATFHSHFHLHFENATINSLKRRQIGEIISALVVWQVTLAATPHIALAIAQQQSKSKPKLDARRRTRRLTMAPQVAWAGLVWYGLAWRGNYMS